MTGQEREDFRDLRQEMRDGFREVTIALKEINVRTATLELARAKDEGGDIANAQNAERRTSESRWRKGVAAAIGVALFGTLCSVVLGLANLALNSGAN